jgi:hypothetical protein
MELLTQISESLQRGDNGNSGDAAGAVKFVKKLMGAA